MRFVFRLDQLYWLARCSMLAAWLPTSEKPTLLNSPRLLHRRPNLLIFMIDATSRAHFRRSLPQTLAALDLIARFGSKAARMRHRSGEAHGSSAYREADAGVGKLHVFDFEMYNVIGYNSMPNQVTASFPARVDNKNPPALVADSHPCLVGTPPCRKRPDSLGPLLFHGCSSWL